MKPGPKPQLGETRLDRITVVLSKEEKARIVAAAGSESASSWLRRIGLNALKSKVPKKSEIEPTQ